MNIWISLVGYQLVWFATVIGAGHGLSWPGLLGLTLWAAFALTFTQSLTYLQTRPLMAAILGSVGGPLAYLGASHGWLENTPAPRSFHSQRLFQTQPVAKFIAPWIGKTLGKNPLEIALPLSIATSADSSARKSATSNTGARIGAGGPSMCAV